MEEPFLSGRDRHLWLSPPFCRKTMCNYMKLNGLIARTREVRIKFTQRHKDLRIAFATDML